MLRPLICLLALVLCTAIPQLAPAQQRAALNRVPVETRIRGVQPLEVNVAIVDSVAFVPLKPFFDFIGIQSQINVQDQVIKGFFRTRDTTYEINVREGRGQIDGRTVPVSGQDIFFEGDTAFVRLGFVNSFFDLNTRFNPRRLTIDLADGDRLPGVIFQKRHAQLLRRVGAQKNLPAPEVDYPREALVTGAGRLNWRLSSSYASSNNYSVPYYLNLGMKVAGGDLSLTSTGTARPRRSTNTTRGQYRIPFPDNEKITQIVLGYLTPFPYYYGEMIGGEVTNRPLGRPRIFSREIFQGSLAPRADIEVTGAGGPPLAVSDENGQYQLDLPVAYGFGTILLRATDQFGQSQQIQYRVRTLTSMIRPGKVEYSLVAGSLNSPINTFTSSNYLSWGVNSYLTVGARLDYFDFPSLREKLFPALTAASRITRQLTFEGFVSPALLSRFALDWTFADFGTMTATATRFGPSDEVNPTGAITQAEIAASVPLASTSRPLLLSASGRLTDFATSQDRTLQLGLNKVFERFSMGISSISGWRRDYATGETAMQSALTNVTFRLELPRAATVTSSWTYDNLAGEISSIQIVASRNIFRSFFVNVSYFGAPNIPATSFGLQLQYRFPFATTSASAIHSNSNTSYSFLGYGSMAFDMSKPYVNLYGFPQPFAVAGFDFNPFVDANGNGKQDAGEQSLTRARLFYGEEQGGGGLTRVPTNKLSVRNLIPYSSYIVYMDPQGLEDPTLVPKATAYRIYTESNYNRHIDIPIVTSTSVRGKVEELRNEAHIPLQGIRIRLVAVAGKRVRETSTFSTGEFEFDLLPPGEYRVELDQTQLTELNLTGDEVSKSVTLEGVERNKVVEGIDFTVKAR